MIKEPFLGKVVDYSIKGGDEIVRFETSPSTIQEFNLKGTELEGWLHNYAEMSDADSEDWVEAGFRDDGSVYFEMLFTSEEIDDLYLKALGHADDPEYRDLKSQLKLEADPMRGVDATELYYSQLS